MGWMPSSGDSLREKSETSLQHFCRAEAPEPLPMGKGTLRPAGCTGPELEPGDPWEAMTSQALLVLQGEMARPSAERPAERLPGAPALLPLLGFLRLPQFSSFLGKLSMEVLSPINNFVTSFILSVNDGELLHILEGLIVKEEQNLDPMEGNIEGSNKKT